MKGDRLFDFNLILPLSEKEINQLEERDTSTVYAFVLIFSAALIFFILNLINASVIQPQLTEAETTLAQKNFQLESYSGVKETNGEFYLKASTLSPILEKDIKITTLIEMVDLMLIDLDSTEILSYSRENTGVFVVNVSLDSFSDIFTVSQNVESSERIEDFFIRNLTQVEDKVNVVLSFNLVKI